MKELLLMLYIFFATGCASMAITPENKGCKLTGWGSGEGSIEGKCTVKKSIFTWPNLTAKVVP